MIIVTAMAAVGSRISEDDGVDDGGIKSFFFRTAKVDCGSNGLLGRDKAGERQYKDLGIPRGTEKRDIYQLVCGMIACNLWGAPRAGFRGIMVR